MTFLITAGPTREHLDDVRFLSNASSGRMGYAIARAAARAGHKVWLVSGPVALRPPVGVRLVRVASTEEMYRVCAKLFPKADCLVGAAAPADYTPVTRARGKSKKRPGIHALRLKPTVDILATLGARKKRQVIIAFALEVQNAVANARRKLIKKNADAIVLNAPDAMGRVRSSSLIITRDGPPTPLHNLTKYQLGRRLVRMSEELARTYHAKAQSLPAMCVPGVAGRKAQSDGSPPFSGRPQRHATTSR